MNTTTPNVTDTYVRAVYSTKSVLRASLVIAIICLVAIITLYVLAYTQNVAYNGKNGPQGPQGKEGLPGSEGPVGPEGPRGETGKHGVESPLVNFKSGNQLIPANTTSSSSGFQILFAPPFYKYENGLPKCFVNCQPRLPNNATTESFTTSVTWIMNESFDITGVNGVVTKFAPTIGWNTEFWIDWFSTALL